MALSHDAVPGGLGTSSQPVRDADLEEMKAINTSIKLFTDVGQLPTSHLLMLKGQIEAKLARERGMVFGEKPAEPAEPVAAPVVEPEFEHAAADELPETAAPRKPGRPRKPSDADRAAGI
jgi:hypothetical protein